MCLYQGSKTPDDKIHHGEPSERLPVFAGQFVRSDGRSPDRHRNRGENVTIEGIGLDRSRHKDQIGDEVLLEVASFTNPCKTIRASFIEGEFIRIAQKLHPGCSRVYARVIREGQVRFGDPVEVSPASE
jgi:MOSC domain-containing protein YiiM